MATNMSDILKNEYQINSTNGWSSIYSFCQFNETSTSVWFRYFADYKTNTINPCVEFSSIMFEHVIFLYFIVLNFFKMTFSPRIPTNSIYITTLVKLITTSCSCVFLIISLFIPLVTTAYELPTILIIEYFLISIIWLIYSLFWYCNIFYEHWHKNKCFNILYSIVSKGFLIIGIQRGLLYSFTDPRSYLLLLGFLFHIINYGNNILEWYLSKNIYVHGLLHENNLLSNVFPSATPTLRTDEEVNLFSRMFYLWTNNLVYKGYKQQLTNLNQLYHLPKSLCVSEIEKKFFESAPSIHIDGYNFSLFTALLNCFGKQYFFLAIPRLIADIASFSGPIFLHLLVTAIEDSDEEKGCIDTLYYSFLIFTSSLISVFCNLHYNFYSNKIGLKVRTATTIAVYEKLLSVPYFSFFSKKDNINSNSNESVSAGKISNFISIDTERITNFVISFHAFWSMPMQLIIALYLIYREVGMAFLSVVVISIIMIPVNKYISTKIGVYSTKMMAMKDMRMKLITETIRGIRQVKLCNWERHFEEKINEIRQKELKYLAYRKYLDALCVYLWASAPVFITVAIFGTYTLWMGQMLTSAKVFTCLALINMLIVPLNAFPWVLNGVIESFVSLKRLNSFFDVKDLDYLSIYDPVEEKLFGQSVLELNNVSFCWNNNDENIGPIYKSLKSINLQIVPSEIVGITGPVGCGKSSLLLGILGELQIINGHNNSICIKPSLLENGIGYVGQECWLKRGTIKENVLCGTKYDPKFYSFVISSTALSYDLTMMPKGDSYLISDGGSTLSGGQKARLALARSVYQNNDLYLLDDPFSSLDKKVAKHIWNKCIIEMLKNRNKAVIMATHNIDFLSKCDKIIILNKNGSIKAQGTPDEVMNEINDINDWKSSNESINDIEKEDELLVGEGIIEIDLKDINEETKEVGTVKAYVFKCYLKSIGLWLSSFILLSIIAMQVTKNGSEMWLSKWISKQNNINGTLSVHYSDPTYPFGSLFNTPFLSSEEFEKTKYYFKIYIIIALSNTMFTLIRSFSFANGAIVATRRLHSKLLSIVFNAKMSWWDSTPYGIVLNRLCSDIYTVDDALPFQLNIFLASTFNLIGSMFLTLFALPYILPIVLVLFVFYYLIQRYYRYTTCEVKRFTTMTLSPLFSHINDTINGIITIKSQRFVKRFVNDLKDKLTNNLRAQYSALAATLWLSIRLQFIGIVMISTVAFGAVIQKHFGTIGVIQQSMIGLAITYALTLTNLLNAILNSFIDTEKEMVSVERINQFIKNIPIEIDSKNNFINNDIENQTIEIENNIERNLIENNSSPVNDYFNNGDIIFHNVFLSYTNDLSTSVLKNINFGIKEGSKIAILGRTGSGKSSLFNLILRAYDITSGYISIGYQDISSISLSTLRSNIAIVTQQPFIFHGTVYENLNIFNITNNESSTNILKEKIKQFFVKSSLENMLEEMNGLDGYIEENGSNLSYGQKQILACIRILLLNPKIVLIDEATAYMDLALHNKMLSLIKEFLPISTVLMIVHHDLNLEQFDGCIYMANGEIKELRNLSKESEKDVFITF
ncbi:Multidrug resistance-associated protein 7 [Strongyloides ratti]|uniref:ABC-type xenobiotic transporter n=1 Tax=Strongyloides ratti TaxID=34506 RepID=A0A090L0J2_STRRB|nr:Multidrug resistance-associated protein 7 [Strongyloides ratti]CEF63280.1 Multidrug resistance-associated protein 7 [Strongyloides ratti]